MTAPVEIDDQVTVTVPVVDDPVLVTKDGLTAEDLRKAVEKARQEERDKLYPKISKQEEIFKATQEELKALREAKEAEEKSRQQTAKEAEAAKKKAAEEEMSAKELIALKEKEWSERLNELKQEQELERAAFQKEKFFGALREYTQQEVGAAVAAGELAPELADLVSGNTQEEIDASINTMKAKSQVIAENFVAATQQQRAATRGVSATGYAPTGPMDNEPGTKRYTPEQIAAMDMSEWAKIRPHLIGGAASNQNRGMYS